jgi:autotransporter-associated beta strand protein
MASASYPVTVSSGATFELRNSITVANYVTINGGTLLSSSGNNALSGLMTLGATGATISVASATQLTLSGIISGGATTSNLLYSGAGLAYIGAANTYLGTTTITNGTVRIATATALGSSAAGTHATTVNSGTLDVIASAAALGDSAKGMALWKRGGSVEFGETRTHTNHWLWRLAEMGSPDFSITADSLLYAVFKRADGQRTYLAWNASSAPLKVTFSDGHTLDVAPRGLAQGH